MLTVYGRATSSNVQLVMWAIGEIGLPYRRFDLGHSFGGLNTPDFLAMNPHGLIPVVRDNDGPPIWESAAILRYLAARYGSETFWPRDPAARAQVDMWAEWGKTTLCAAFTRPIFWSRVRTAAADRDEAALTRAVARFHALLARLDAQILGRAYVTGPDLTAADIVIGHILYRYFDVDIPRSDHSNVAAYYARLTERPAYREHVMVDYSDLRAAGA